MWVHLHVRVLLPMAVEMHFEISTGGKTVATDIALIGPLTGVGTKMDL
jgi:hypothetical protein